MIGPGGRAGLATILGLVVVATAACQAPGPAPSADVRDIRGPLDAAAYPARVGGLRRAGVIAFAPDDSSVAVTYRMEDPEAQVTIMLFRAERAAGQDDLRTRFEAEKDFVLSQHPGAELLAEKSTRVESSRVVGAPTLMAAFRYDGVFRGRSRRIYSELLVWETATLAMKMRSSAPVEHWQSALQGGQDLLEQVDWTRPVR